MLSSGGDSGHRCLVPDFKGNTFNFSPLRVMFSVGLSYMAFIILRYIPFMTAFWRAWFGFLSTLPMSTFYVAYLDCLHLK